MEINFTDIERGRRLKEQRVSFDKLTQIKAAEIAGVKEQAWVRYEKHGDPFDLKVVQLLEAYGFDMMYVLFGIRRSALNKAPENQLAKLYETVEPEQREGLIYLAKAFAAAYPVK